VPEVESCPKCATRVNPARTHCATCGLAHERMAAFAKTRDDVAEPLTNAWQRAVEGWDERARHDEVLRLVTQHDAYAWAAARYRDRLKEQPGDAVGTEQLERIKRAAEATLVANAAVRDTKTPGPYRNTVLILVVFILAIVAGLIYSMVRGSGKPDMPHRRLQPPGASK
jgi:hypothetical protein